MSDETRSKNTEALASVIDAETTAAYGRKTSLETRAGSIVVAAGAVVTVFLALRQALDLNLALLDPFPATVTGLGLILAGAALLFGIASAIPIRYTSLDAEFVRVLLRDDIDRTDLREELIDLRASALTRISTANSIKGWIVLCGYSLVVLSVLALATSIIVAAKLFP